MFAQDMSYGLAEATAREKQFTTAWTSWDTVDDTRRKAETKAFEQLLDDFSVTWGRILTKHIAYAPRRPGQYEQASTLSGQVYYTEVPD